MKRNGQLKLISLLFVLLMAGLLAFGSMFTVSERELAVVLQFGQPVESIKEPGLYFKIPFIQEVRRLPRTRQFWRSSEAETLVDLPTKDGKKIEVSAWAIWRITDPEKFVRVLRSVDNAEQAVKLRVRAAIRDVITSYDLSEVVRSTNRELTYSFRFEQPDADNPDAAAPTQPGEIDNVRVGREKIIAEIMQKVQEKLSGAPVEADPIAETDQRVDRGIELVDVGISNIGFVASVRQASFARLNAFMESIAAGYENAGVQRKQEILNQTQAEVQKILGEGEEQSNVIRGKVDAENIEKYARTIERTGDFYNFIRTLEVYQNAMSGETRLILTTDSDLFRLLKKIPEAARPAPADRSGAGP